MTSPFDVTASQFIPAGARSEIVSADRAGRQKGGLAAARQLSGGRRPCFPAPMAVNFALSAARAQAKATRRETRTELKQAVAGWRERRGNDLQEMGIVIPLSEWIGHNNGPDILESLLFKEWRWRQCQEAAFAAPDMETGRRWALNAEKLGLTYREYRLELLERGRHPTEEDARRIRAARPPSP